MTDTLESLGLTTADLTTLRRASDYGTPWEDCRTCAHRQNRIADLAVFAYREDELFKLYCPRHARSLAERGWITAPPSTYR